MFPVCLPPQLAFCHLSPVQIARYKSWKILWEKIVVDAWTFAGNTSGRSGTYSLWARYYGIADFRLVGFNWLGHLSTFWLLNLHFAVSLVALPVCFTLSQMEKWEGIHLRGEKMLVERKGIHTQRVWDTYCHHQKSLPLVIEWFLTLECTRREWNKMGNLELVWRRSKLRLL